MAELIYRLPWEELINPSSDAPTREEAIAKIMKSGRTREEASDIVTELGFK